RHEAVEHVVAPGAPHVGRDTVVRVADRPRDTQGRRVVVPGRGDRLASTQRSEGECQKRAPHLLAEALAAQTPAPQLLAVALAARRRDQPGGAVDRPQLREVVALEFLPAQELAATADSE